MKADQIRELGYSYLEGELPDETMKEIERLLETSPEARAQLAELEAFNAILPHWQVPAPSEEFADGVIERIRSESAGPLASPGKGTAAPASSRRTWRVPAHVALAATLLLAVSIGFNVISYVYNTDLQRTNDSLQSENDSLAAGSGSADTRTMVYPVAFEPVPAAFHYFADPRDTADDSMDPEIPEIVP